MSSRVAESLSRRVAESLSRRVAESLRNPSHAHVVADLHPHASERVATQHYDAPVLHHTLPLPDPRRERRLAASQRRVDEDLAGAFPQVVPHRLILGRRPCSEQKIAQFRTHYLTKERAYVSTQSSGQLNTFYLNHFSVCWKVA
jgi:hypothetical protein